jgi:hypothetical protein
MIRMLTPLRWLLNRIELVSHRPLAQCGERVVARSGNREQEKGGTLSQKDAGN